MELVRKLKVYRNVGLFLCEKTCFVLHNSIYLYCGNEAMLKYTPMKNLKDLTKQYGNKFHKLCKLAWKNGMDDYFYEWRDVREVCVELSIDVVEIEKIYWKH